MQTMLGDAAVEFNDTYMDSLPVLFPCQNLKVPYSKKCIFLQTEFL